MNKTSRIVPDAVFIDSGISGKDEALERLISRVLEANGIDDFDGIHHMIADREGKMSTGIGLEIAVPHCRVASVKQAVIGALLIPEGIEYNSVDGLPVKLMFLLVSPEHDVAGHLASLSSISRAVSDEASRTRLLSSKTADDLYRGIVGAVAGRQ